MKSVEIYVATHKKMDLVLPDYCKFVQVNANKQGQWTGYIHDNDSQDNISDKNNSYCELTALYELWKNSTAEIGGLFHYRRYLTGKTSVNVRNEWQTFQREKDINRHIISEERIIELLDHSEVILGLPNAPLPLTAFEDLQKFVYIDDIWQMIDIIEKEYPEYQKSLWEILFLNNISYCNIFIAKREFIDQYCNWLFEILARIESRVSIKEYDKSHQRIFGYLAEILLNVYVHHNQIKIQYVYRIDLFEGDLEKTTKQKIRTAINSILSTMGVYPLVESRGIYKARYLSCKYNGKGFNLPKVLISGEIDQAKRYFRKCGCRYSCVSVGGQYDKIIADGFMATVNFFYCKTKEDVREIEQIIGEENKTEKNFGFVAAYRLFCAEGMEKNESRRLLRKGITVIG